MIKTEICDLIGIKYPIFQGGMAWVADASLASAVSNAGGLGIIAAMNSNGEQLRAEINKTRQMTNKPFGVNIMLISPYVDEVAKVVAEEKIEVVTTGAGNPTKYMSMWKKANIKVIPVIASVAMARLVFRAGAVAVIAEGGESGGHVGDLTTMALVPQVVDAVKIPVIAAGGIGCGRQAAAAFILGAKGLQLGTKFLVANECSISDVYKDKIISAGDISTIVTGKRLGHPVRALKTPFTRDFFSKEYNSAISNEELEKLGGGALRLAARNGDENNGCFMAGQIAAMVKCRQSCKEIIEELFLDMETSLKTAINFVE